MEGIHIDMFNRFAMASIGKRVSIAYKDVIKYIIYAFFSQYTNNTWTLILLNFVYTRFRVYNNYFLSPPCKNKLLNILGDVKNKIHNNDSISIILNLLNR